MQVLYQLSYAPMPSALERREHATAYVRSTEPGTCAIVGPGESLAPLK